MIKKSDQDFVRKLRLSSTVQCTSTYENWESRKIVCHFLEAIMFGPTVAETREIAKVI